VRAEASLGESKRESSAVFLGVPSAENSEKILLWLSAVSVLSESEARSRAASRFSVALIPRVA
jgi:hypothetical protein